MKSNLLRNPEQAIPSFFDTKASKSGVKAEIESMLAKILEKTAKKQENKLQKSSVWSSRCKTIIPVDKASFRKCNPKLEIVTKQLRRVFDPFDERWVFIDEPTPDCLSSHEKIKIIKNEGGEKE